MKSTFHLGRIEKRYLYCVRRAINDCFYLRVQGKNTAFHTRYITVAFFLSLALFMVKKIVGILDAALFLIFTRQPFFLFTLRILRDGLKRV